MEAPLHPQLEYLVKAWEKDERVQVKFIRRVMPLYFKVLSYDEHFEPSRYEVCLEIRDWLIEGVETHESTGSTNKGQAF